MAFTLSGSIIIQSGTDANLSGLSAIAGVTTTTTGNQKSYSVGTLQLIIDGTLTIDPRIEELVSNKGNVGVRVASSGTLNLGLQVTTNGYTYQTSGVAYRNGASPAAWFGPYLATDGALVVVSGGTLNWYGATICLPLNGFHIASGAVFNAINAVCEGSAIAAGGAPAGRCVISSISTNATINGFVMRGGELIFAGNAPSANISGLTREASALATFTNRVSTMSFTDLAVGAKGNVIDVPIQSEDVTLTNTTVVNSQTGTNLIVVGGENAPDSRNKGYVSIRKRAIFSAKTQLGANIQDAIVYIKDTNNGVRKNLNGIDDTADKVYIYQTNGSGVTSSFDVVTGIVNVAGSNNRGTSNVAPYTFDLRGRTNTLGSDDFYSYVMQYGYGITLLPVALKGINTTTYNATLLADSNVTLSRAAALTKLASSFTVNTSTNTITVTANSTLSDLYDAMKAYKCQAVQANLEYPTINTQPVNAVGPNLITAMTVVVNSGVTLSTSAKFNQLSAPVTNNGTLSSGLTVTGNITQATPTDLTGVTVTGNLTFNTNTDVTVTFTDCTVTGTISNTGTGIVKVVKAGTTPWLTAGTNVSNIAYATITTNDDLALSTYVTKNGETDLGWVAQNTARTLELGQSDTFQIYAIAYGYKAALISASSADLTSFKVNLIPEPYIDTTLSTVTRDLIASKFSVSLDAYYRISLALDSDLRTYTPEDVMNAVQYFLVTQGALIAQGVVYGGTIDGVTIVQGGISIGTPGFYGQVNNSVATTNDLGILIPIYIDVLPSVYAVDPTYTPVKKNTSGITLQTSPWTKQTATISSSDRTVMAVTTSTAVWSSTDGKSALNNSKLIPGLL